MTLELQGAQSLDWRIAQLEDTGALHPNDIGIGKLNDIRLARHARTILGANGITTENPVMRHAANLESVLTYGGTAELHTLILGHGLTAMRAVA